MSPRQDVEARRAYEKWKKGRCSYRCAVCGETLPHSLKFYRHLAEAHWSIGGHKEYFAMYGSARRKTDRIRCLSCGETVLYDYGELKAHFRLVPHTDPHLIDLGIPVMDLPQYFLLHVYGQEPGEHGCGASQEEAVAAAAAATPDVSSATVAAVGNYVDAGSSSGGGGRDDVIGNFCQFLCPICNRATFSWSTMVVHMRKHPASAREGLGVKRFRGQLKYDKTKFLVEPGRRHRCRKCGDLLLLDRWIVTNHVRGHRLALDSYAERYGLEVAASQKRPRHHHDKTRQKVHP